ncbi:MAG: hypothetical protein H8E96_01230 [Verrucomicrobiaceae bacterium]|nr:hypothetical protein [Verrucomicrobiaceae bacterium]
MIRRFPRLSLAFSEVVTRPVMVISFPTRPVMSHYLKPADWRRTYLVSEVGAE